MTRIPPTLFTYEVPRHVIDDSWDLLREPGEQGFEAVVLWVGTVHDETTASVVAAVRPGQRAMSGDGGCAVEVPPEALRQLISALPDHIVVLVRLHTHPGEAYHSPVDDTNMLIAHEGAISIVVPDFAVAALDLATCSVNELRSQDGWRELEPEEVTERFPIT